LIALSDFIFRLGSWALLVFALWLAWLALRPLLVRKLSAMILANPPRPQRIGFVYRLRDTFFNDPSRCMNLLCSPEGPAWLHQAWREAHARFTTDPPPTTHLELKPMQLHDGRRIAVIQWPEPVRDGEAYLLAVVLPSDTSLQTDLPRARQALRVFVLNRFGGPGAARSTDLCAWMIQRGKMRHLTYNVGAPQSIEGFAQTVENKLRELGW
jgi:hypothetical protein